MRALIGETEKERRELLRDVCVFATASGCARDEDTEKHVGRVFLWIVLCGECSITYLRIVARLHLLWDLMVRRRWTCRCIVSLLVLCNARFNGICLDCGFSLALITVVLMVWCSIIIATHFKTDIYL